MKSIITNEMLAKNLKIARMSAGLTQEQVADLLGITRVTFNSYENNPGNVAISVFQKLADIYKLNVCDFFTETH